jgi:hypothetical protein
LHYFINNTLGWREDVGYAEICKKSRKKYIFHPKDSLKKISSKLIFEVFLF